MLLPILFMQIVKPIAAPRILGCTCSVMKCNPPNMQHCVLTYHLIMCCCDLLQKLSSEVEQHLLTIQQLTQQVQALTSLKRSRSISEQPPSDSDLKTPDSAARSQTTDFDIDTFPGLEVKGAAQFADAASKSTGDSIAAFSPVKPTIRTVDLGDEVRLTLIMESCFVTLHLTSLALVVLDL